MRIALLAVTLVAAASSSSRGGCGPAPAPSSQACVGKACGDTCNPCAPSACMSPVAYACDPAHQCVPTAPDLCGGGKWYYTCGDIVCSVWRPDPSIPLCTTQKVGDACPTLGEKCDPQSGCNQRLVCATSDPAYMCPISRAKYKTDIQYLGGAELDRVRDDLLEIKLATYRYRAGGPGAPVQLGFIIDDVGGGPSVNADGETVNLYGYTSMAVAALQAQERELAALREEVASLRRQVEAKSAPRSRRTAEGRRVDGAPPSAAPARSGP